MQWADGRRLEEPVESFFRRLGAIRATIGALERAIDEHPALVESDRGGMRRYLRSMEGSLTTFNLLFRHRSQGFHGTGRR